MNGKKLSFFMFAVVAILLVGCTNKPGTAENQPTNTQEATSSPTSRPLLPGTTPQVSPTPNPDYSPTPDLRLKPEQWQDWPVVPEISPNARQIYARGLGMGTNPHAFSKVGDCQSITEAFLGIYEKPGLYDLTDQYQSLQETIDWYKGSFGRESQAVRGGFNAASVLLPLWADPNACRSGETPVECEIRIHKPSLVIISLEVWFKGRTPEIYAGYLRQIIEYTVSKGVLPVLATKADNVEGDHSINLTVAQLAYEYDIPMWNFWRAVQPLPDQGIDWARDEQGFHITVDAWNMRSFSALQVLDALQRELADQASEPQDMPTGKSGPTPDPGFKPADMENLPDAIKDAFTTSATGLPGILFSLEKRTLDATQPMGIFRGAMDAGGWTNLASAGYRLLDISPDGKKGLISFSNHLYLLDLEHPTPREINNKLASIPQQPAYFISNEDVAAILMDGSVGLYVLSGEGSDSRKLDTSGVVPLELVPSRFSEKIYWYSGSCNLSFECTTDKLYVSPLNGEPSGLIDAPGELSISPQGTLAFVVSREETWNYLTLVQGEESHGMWIPGNRLIDMAWSQDGSTLALSTVSVSGYSGKIEQNFHTLVTWPDVIRPLYFSEGKVTEKILWSPDGIALLIMRRDISGTDNILNFNLVDTRDNLILPGGFSLKSESYFNLPRLFWLEAKE